MTLQTADVANLKCVAFDKIYSHISCYTYSEDCCSTEAKQALAATLYEPTCNLTTDTECAIGELASVTRPTCSFTLMPCNAQVNISVVAKPSACTYSAVAKNTQNKSNKPFLTLTPNSIYHKSAIDIYAESKCGDTEHETVQGGCYPDGVCNSTFDVSAETYFSLLVGTQTSGYVSSLRLHTTDASGLGPLIPFDVKIGPGFLSSWTSCIGCEAILSADILFGSSNFNVAFGKLLKNVSRTLYGDVFIEPNITKVNPGTTNFKINIGTRAKHLPSARWIGINPDASSVTWANNAGTLTAITHTPRVDAIIAAYPGRIADNYNITLPCGSIMNTSVSSTNLDFPIDAANSNIHNLIFNSYFANNAPTFISTPPTATCSGTNLTATVTSDQIIVSTEWLDDTMSVVSSTTTLYAGPGEYTFKVTTINGCVIEYPVTVL